jgi:microcystin-dependent protein
MATLSIPHSFTNNTVASATEVNQNFLNVKAFADAAVVQVDGSVQAPTAAIANNAVTLAKLAAAVQNALVPVGSIVATARTTAPTGWLMCDGTSTAGYTTLASYVGATTPDLRGRFPLGDSSALTLLSAGGSTSITTANMPVHTHTQSPHNHDQAAHSHTIDPHTHTNQATVISSAVSHAHGNTTDYVAAGTNGASTTPTIASISATGLSTNPTLAVNVANGAVIGDTGSGTAYYQPHVVVNFIIKHD